MAQIAYGRIINYCRASERENSDPSRDNEMVLDAWSFVDVSKRLRTLLQHTPGLKHSASLKLFLIETRKIPAFRHHLQHVEEKASGVAHTGRPIWGSFSWVKVASDGKGFEIALYVPGRLAKTKGIPIVNPAGRIFHADIDHFEITIGSETLNLSEINRRIELLEQQFNTALKKASPRPIPPNNEAILTIDLWVR
jgi:hypothetical protein